MNIERTSSEDMLAHIIENVPLRSNDMKLNNDRHNLKSQAYCFFCLRRLQYLPSGKMNTCYQLCSMNQYT